MRSDGILCADHFADDTQEARDEAEQVAGRVQRRDLHCVHWVAQRTRHHTCNGDVRERASEGALGRARA